MIKLRSDQILAVDRLQNGNILCGDVGSGKSLVSLFYYYEKVCNGCLSDQKYKKAEQEIPLYIITTARKRDTLDWEKECSTIGLSIENMIVDSWNNMYKYKGVKDAFFIFDEQRVVGYGVWTKNFLKITKNNKWIMLSATPGDRWMDFAPVFIANGFYKNKTEFEDRHVIYSRFSKYPKVDRYVEIGRLQRLKNQILVPIHYQRHTVSHVEKIYLDYNVLAERRILKDRWNIYLDKPITNVNEMCLALRRLVNSDISRFEELLKMFYKHKRLIVFYNFDYELELLLHFCKENNIIVAEWNGHQHQPIPKDATWIYLVQYTAGSEGWNCVETDTTVFFSQTYSYRATVQAAGRINRANTTFNDLYYYHFMSRSEIDKAIYKALSMKKNFNEKKYFGF